MKLHVVQIREGRLWSLTDAQLDILQHVALVMLLERIASVYYFHLDL